MKRPVIAGFVNPKSFIAMDALLKQRKYRTRNYDDIAASNAERKVVQKIQQCSVYLTGKVTKLSLCLALCASMGTN